VESLNTAINPQSAGVFSEVVDMLGKVAGRSSG